MGTMCPAPRALGAEVRAQDPRGRVSIILLQGHPPDRREQPLAAFFFLSGMFPHQGQSSSPLHNRPCLWLRFWRACGHLPGSHPTLRSPLWPWDLIWCLEFLPTDPGTAAASRGSWGPTQAFTTGCHVSAVARPGEGECDRGLRKDLEANLCPGADTEARHFSGGGLEARVNIGCGASGWASLEPMVAQGPRATGDTWSRRGRPQVEGQGGQSPVCIGWVALLSCRCPSYNSAIATCPQGQCPPSLPMAPGWRPLDPTAPPGAGGGCPGRA